ncbi:hypothetical protein EDC01DRAFT_233610 [Geopyxis carbonaria]|nr:hypothetical protein EDC01DRAFT_233610 [Geopyxis carbonaria]
MRKVLKNPIAVMRKVLSPMWPLQKSHRYMRKVLSPMWPLQKSHRFMRKVLSPMWPLQKSHRYMRKVLSPMWPLQKSHRFMRKVLSPMWPLQKSHRYMRKVLSPMWPLQKSHRFMRKVLLKPVVAVYKNPLAICLRYSNLSCIGSLLHNYDTLSRYFEIIPFPACTISSSRSTIFYDHVDLLYAFVILGAAFSYPALMDPTIFVCLMLH